LLVLVFLRLCPAGLMACKHATWDGNFQGLIFRA
jgi:hypothetical protein